MAARPPAPNKPAATVKSVVSDSRLVPMLNYFLVFLMVMTMGLSGILALLIANFREDKAADWLKTHYAFQKRTFWIGIVPTLAVFVAVLRLHLTDQRTMLVLLAIPLAYTAGRAVLGFNHLFYERPVPRPKAWII
jgi:uncharacterized membrane protein